MSGQRFPSVAFTRLGLLVGVPIAVFLGVEAVAWALSLKTWTGGETLKAADLNANFSAINAEITPPAWTAVATFGTGWVNYPDTQYGAVSYRKIGNLVYMRGLAQTTDLNASPVAFTLPTGYRPTSRVVLGVNCVATGSQECRLDVLADGTVETVGMSGGGHVSFDGTVFSTD